MGCLYRNVIPVIDGILKARLHLRVRVRVRARVRACMRVYPSCICMCSTMSTVFTHVVVSHNDDVL